MALHVGLIPDGTRGWARASDVDLVDAYYQTFSRVRELTEHLLDGDATAVSIFMLSRRNCERPSDELAAIFEAEARVCGEMADSLARRDGRAVVAGNTDGRISEEFATALAGLRERTSGGERPVYFCVAYDPFEEVVSATSQGAVPADQLLDRLWVPDLLDLVIRSSGNSRLSDFLPLQASYAQLYFLPQPFVDVLPADVDAVLDDFKGVNRMWGH